MRSDVTPTELATYCLNALAAASEMSSKAAVRRLVSVILTGLRPALERQDPYRQAAFVAK